MNIGIITVHRSTVNYGACLQAFALWSYLQNKGHKCEVIDLLRPLHKKYKHKLCLRSLKSIYTGKVKFPIQRFITRVRYPDFIKRENAYIEFNNMIKYSNEYRCFQDIKKTPPEYDIYISGSDQIWNPYMPFDNDAYLLSFVPPKKKRIAYASSFGIGSLPVNVKKRYKELLSEYNFLSTRENAGKNIINDLLGKEVPVVLDPVFLLSKEEWYRLIDNSYNTYKDYVLVYSLHKNQDLLNFAIKTAKEKNLKVIMVNAGYNVCTEPNVIQLCDAGPAQWLALIKNANLFFTDSFHGTAFALIFNVDFLVYLRASSKVNDRITTLLSKINMLNHIINENEKYTYNQLIEKSRENINSYFPILELEIKKSKDYLFAAINN